MSERKTSKDSGFRASAASNGAAQLLTVRRFCLLTEPFVVAVPRMTFLPDDGVSRLETDHVAELCHGSTGAKKVPEFVPAVNRRRIPDDVIMNVVFIYVSADQESVLFLQKPRGKFITELVRVFRRDLSRTKSLTHLICDHIILSALARLWIYTAFWQKETRRRQCADRIHTKKYKSRRRSFRVLCIISPVAEALCDGCPLCSRAWR